MDAKFSMQFSFKTKMKPKLLEIFALFVFFSSVSLRASEITVLPSYVYGSNKPMFLLRTNPSTSIAELISYYASVDFQTDVTDFRAVKDFIGSEKITLERTLTMPIISRICTQFESDYVIKSNLEIDIEIQVDTEVYNCRNLSKKTYGETIKSDFFEGIERHTLRFLDFLPAKKAKAGTPYITKQEIIFVLDLSGSFTSDSKQAIIFINRILEEKGISVGLMTIGKGKTFYRKPDASNQKIISDLKALRSGGELSSEELSDSLLKLMAELDNEDQENKNRKIVIMTDCNLKNQNPSYENAIASLKRKSHSVSLISGSFFSNDSLNLHKKAARKSGQELIQLTHSQKIGTSEGYKLLKLKDFRLSVWKTDESANESESSISPAKIQSHVEFPHPQNMAYLFEKVSGKKILEKSPVRSDIDTILENIVFGNPDPSGNLFRKVLIKSDGIAFWMNFKKLDERYLEQDIFVESVFVNSRVSSSGFSNLPDETRIYRNIPPSLLVFNPREIAQKLSEKKATSIKCFVRGKILEIK